MSPTHDRAAVRRALSPTLLLACIVLIAWMASLAEPDRAHATASSQAVEAVNQVRARVGVAPIANDETLASACRLHATWMRLNDTVSHVEAAGTPGYTLGGNDAAMRSVLHGAFFFTPQTTPATIHWLRGYPLHLVQLLHPGLVRSGYAFDGSYSCMFTLNPALLPDVDVHDRSLGRNEVFTWPPNGATDVPRAENTAGENPNPNEQIGLPRAQTTGPYLLVYGSGFGGISPLCNELKIVSATLTAPGGAAVPIRFWDDVKAGGGQPGACRVPAGSGYVVAEQPLAQRTTYTATVELLAGDAPAGTAPKQHSWTFTTTGTRDVARPVVRVTTRSLVRRGARSAFRFLATVRDASPTTCTAIVAGRRAPCTVRGGRISVAGLRAGTPRTMSMTLVVRDRAGNRTRTVATARRR